MSKGQGVLMPKDRGGDFDEPSYLATAAPSTSETDRQTTSERLFRMFRPRTPCQLSISRNCPRKRTFLEILIRRRWLARYSLFRRMLPIHIALRAAMRRMPRQVNAEVETHPHWRYRSTWERRGFLLPGCFGFDGDERKRATADRIGPRPPRLHCRSPERP